MNNALCSFFYFFIFIFSCSRVLKSYNIHAYGMRGEGRALWIKEPKISRQYTHILSIPHDKLIDGDSRMLFIFACAKHYFTSQSTFNKSFLIYYLFKPSDVIITVLHLFILILYGSDGLFPQLL